MMTRPTPAEEDYLLAINRIGGSVRTSQLARALRVSHPSVTAMMDKLAVKGLLVKSAHRPVNLTEKGRRVSNRLVRRHRLIELFLMNVLGYPWDQVHSEAHQMEHYVSDEFVDRIDRFLGYPLHDPHGSPIPNAQGQSAGSDAIPLTQLSPGGRAQVAEVSDHDPELLRYMARIGLVPGVSFRLVNVRDATGTWTVQIGDMQVTLGIQAVQFIKVKKTD